MSKSQLQNNLNNENLSGTTKLISKSILKNKPKVPIATLKTNFGSGEQDNTIYFAKSGKYEVRDILPESEHFGFNNSKEHIKQKLIILKDLLKDCQDQNVKIWLRDKINECIIEMY